MNSNGNRNGYKYINNLWKMQNFTIYCANNPDAASQNKFHYYLPKEERKRK